MVIIKLFPEMVKTLGVNKAQSLLVHSVYVCMYTCTSTCIARTYMYIVYNYVYMYLAFCM